MTSGVCKMIEAHKNNYKMQEKVCILGLQKRIKEVNLRSEKASVPIQSFTK